MSDKPRRLESLPKNRKRRWRYPYAPCYNNSVPTWQLFLSQDAFDEPARAKLVNGQRASGMRFGDPKVLAVQAAPVMFRLLSEGFSNRELREIVARLLALLPQEIAPGQMRYQLRRLRLRGLIERLAGRNRYRLTDPGLRTALFSTCSASPVIRPLATAVDKAGGGLQERILRRLQPFVLDACELKTAA